MQLDGVFDANVSLAHEEALIHYDPERVSPARLRDTLRRLGYTVRDPHKVQGFEQQEAELRGYRRQLLIAGGMALVAVGFMSAMWLGVRRPWLPWVMWVLSLGMVIGVGRPILKMAWASLRRGILNQHVLMECGAFGGLSGGIAGFFVAPWPTMDFMGAAVFITAYHILSGYVSLLVRTRSSQAIRKVMDLQPAVARVVRDGGEEEMPVEQVRAGDRVRVRPGERIPVDGEVIAGMSAVDQGLVTGESIPVEKVPGDQVIGGSLNQMGTLLVSTTKTGEESFLQRVVFAIEEARAMKPGVMQLVDRVLKFFVPGVLIAAGAAVLFWTLGVWAVTGAADFSRAAFAGLAVLVMGYPCALGMAGPLAMIRGGGIAAQQGILMRSGEAFQVFKDVKKMVLDKTGTLTLGKPRVAEVIATGAITASEVMALAAAAEAPSAHPLARAIVQHAESLGLTPRPVTDFQFIAGRGVRAKIGETAVQVATPRFLSEDGVVMIRDTILHLERQGCTVAAVARNDEIVGVIGITDTLKDDARETIARVRAAGLEPVMITGDNVRAARTVAGQVGIDEVIAEVLPEDKAAQVRMFQRQGFRVAMVGDGINDAPALMQADVGIAIGAGIDIAIEAADIVLVGDRLGGVVDAFHIARNSYRKTVQNVMLAFAFNGIGILVAITGLLQPVMAMVAMAASVTTVLLNSFGGRLLPARRRIKGQETTETKRLVLKVPTMHCEGCLAQIREALVGVPGVKNVEGDLVAKTITVESDAVLVRETLCEKLGRIGHLCGES